MERWFVQVCSVAVLLGMGVVCGAGIRAPGKYCGVVIFDRWDGCMLYSGVYVMYVSEKTKEGLRKYKGQAVQIDAKEVFQLLNPGDGRIGKFDYLGKAPQKMEWVKLEGINLETSVKVGQDGKAVATLTIWNKGNDAVKLFSQELALTLLMKRSAPQKGVSVFDGPSFALITRQSFEIAGSLRCEGKGVTEGIPYSWTIDNEKALPHDFTMAPGEKKRIDILLELPDGQYDFLCGYGGGVHEGMGLASNLSAFDVKDGKAKVVEIKDR